MLKLNKYKHNTKKPYHDNVRLPLRMVIYKTVCRDELTQYSKRDTKKGHNQYRKYADLDDEVYTVKNVQDNNHNMQTNINFVSSKSSSVLDIFNKSVKNKVNFQFENVISKNHSFKFDENKNIQEINVYNAVDLLKINEDKSYHLTKFEFNHVVFDLHEISSEDNTSKQNEDFNTLEEKNTSISSTLQHQKFFNNKHFMNGLHLFGICNKTDLQVTKNK